MPKDDCTDSVDPVDEFVPIDIDESRTLSVISVNRADPLSKSASESAPKLGVTWYNLTGTFINLDGFFDALISVFSNDGSPFIVT